MDENAIQDYAAQKEQREMQNKAFLVIGMLAVFVFCGLLLDEWRSPEQHQQYPSRFVVKHGPGDLRSIQADILCPPEPKSKPALGMPVAWGLREQK